jgi:hypothetical protein
MWMMTKFGAYSCIEWSEPGPLDGTICVRARMPGDIDRLRKVMPKLSEEAISPTADYRYRAWVDKAGFAAGMAAVALEVDYGNFKSAVEKTKLPVRYKDGLHRIWSIMASWQPGGAYGVGGTVPIPKSEKAALAKKVQK